MNRIITTFTLILLLCVAPFSLAQETNSTPGAAEGGNTDTWRHFENLVTTISKAERELDQARKTLVNSQHETEREDARAEVERLYLELNSLKVAWEVWATGGVDMELFASADVTEKFNWQSELESVFEPILAELRRLTDRPRKIERLRSEQFEYQQRLLAAERAHETLTEYRVMAPSPELVNAFTVLENRWLGRRDDMKNKLDLVNYELNELLTSSVDTKEEAIDQLKKLFSGRILNLFLAVFAAIFVYLLIWQLNRLYTRYLLSRGKRPSLTARIIRLALVVVGAALAFLAAMVVLYTRGDWLLLGLLIIILVGMALALQRYLPGYMAEAKLMLNIGAVREGERVIYNGLPWKVQSLNVYSRLVNPVLSGGIIRLPLSALTPLVSRHYEKREPWFPTREKDYVVLSDNTFGQVVLQTPENVLLREIGSVTNFSTASFLEQNPRNLSLDGFAVILRFGLDYQHQADVTSTIPETLENYLTNRLQQHPVGEHIQSVTFEFAEAGASSLDFIGIVSVDSAAAGSYLQLNRLLQKIAVDACNENGWIIPFNQMTVHLERDGE